MENRIYPYYLFTFQFEALNMITMCTTLMKNIEVKYMLAQVMEVMFPDMPYTSDGTWESVVFEDPNFVKPLDDVYETALHKLQNADAIKKFREERNALLNDSDKYMTPDYPHRLEKDIQDWKEYRRALRDLPITARPTLDEDGKLKDVEWPTPPQ